MFQFSRRTLVAFAAVTIFAGATSAQDTLQIASGDITVVCPLTVGGSFEAKTKALTGDVAIANGQQGSTGSAAANPQPVGTSGSAENATPHALTGEILVDLQKLETGIGLRDRHLKENYLEVGRGREFATARLQDIRVDRLQGKTPFRGTLTLHGERREVTGTANIKPHGPGYHLDATFPVRVSEFKIPEPTYLGVGVQDEITVRVNLSATPAASRSASRR